MSIQHYVAANANPVRPDEATHYRHLVTYADHLDALRACEHRVIGEAVQRMEALWSLDASWDGTNWNNALTSALAAIDAPREER